MSVHDPNDETRYLDPRIADKVAYERTPALVVIQGNEIGRRFRLERGRLILGRDPKRADLVISDASVSGKHALVSVDAEAGRYGLIDLGSRNGTRLNGNPVESAALREGDRIFLGETVLKFTIHDSLEDDYHSQINQLMHVDSLTGLYVRRWFDAEYPKAFELVRAGSEPFCLMMMDMDGLKAVNDCHGHQMGSYCISEAGKIIKEKIAPDGVGCRFGGDEFVVFLRGHVLDQAVEIAESIREAIEEFEFRQGDVVVAPTISIGVAELGNEIRTAEDLTRVGDQALYRAKEAGRNAVRTGDSLRC